MFQKLKNVLNVKAWIESFVGKMIVQKGVKHAVTAVAGLLGTAAFQTKVMPVMTSLGINVDQTQLQVGLTTFFAAGAGWLLNWAQRAMHITDEPGSSAVSTPPAQ